MRVLPVLAVMCLGLVAVRPARAQTHFGPELSWASNSIGIGIGAKVDMGLAKMIPGAKDFSATAAFDYFFPSTGYGVSPSYWELGVGGAYHFSIPNSKILPYAGAGLAVAHSSVSVLGVSASATNIGLNLFGGTNFETSGKITPFAQIRLELQSSSAVVLTGGVLF